MKKSLVVRCVLLGVCIFIIITIFYFFRYGSISLAIAHLQGKSFLVFPLEIELGNCESGTRHVKTFTVTNLTAKPIQIAGSEEGCPCTMIDELPIDIDSHKSKSISIRTKVSGEGEFLHPVILFLDDGQLRSVAMRVHAYVYKANSGSISDKSD